MGLHADEVVVDVGLARRLLAAQLPRWADLTLTPLAAAGTDNVLLRIGDDLVGRFPRQASAVDSLLRERRWLPELAPRLPVPVPRPLAAGVPGEGYPWPWSVYGWLDGRPVTPADAGPRFARDLGAFVTALRAVPVPADPPSSYRGGPLAARDADTRAAVAACADELDVRAVLAAWDRALAAPAGTGRTWFHGDLHGDNLLVGPGGGLAAVLDLGGVAVGEPSIDLAPAWTLFDGAARTAYRDAVGADDAAWDRGRGWTLSVALVALPYYRRTHPGITAWSRRQIAAVLADR